MHVHVLRRLLIVLLAITLVALLWNQFGMNTSMVIDAGSSYPAYAVDDRASAHGRSVGTVVRDDGAIGLDCQIAAGYEWPFCELRLELRKAPQGVDLSRYDSVRLWLKASGPEAQQ